MVSLFKAFQVAHNMAIDMMETKIEENCLSSQYRKYYPKRCYNLIEKVFIGYLRNKLEITARKLKTVNLDSLSLKIKFIKVVEKLFSFYFYESYQISHYENGEEKELELLCIPPQEDKPMTLVMIHSKNSVTEIATIDKICNISVQKRNVQQKGNIEIYRKNGVPLYFRMRSDMKQNSLLTLLCTYFRLTEKWTFSLCAEIIYPVLDNLSFNKIHGPIVKKFAEKKLKSHGCAEGLFLLRQSTVDYKTLYLHF